MSVSHIARDAYLASKRRVEAQGGWPFCICPAAAGDPDTIWLIDRGWDDEDAEPGEYETREGAMRAATRMNHAEAARLVRQAS